jgi:hypothetical protein
MTQKLDDAVSSAKVTKRELRKGNWGVERKHVKQRAVFHSTNKY